MNDAVKHPKHYCEGGIETIDFIRAKLGVGFQDYCIGNVLKYISRYKYKDNPTEDLEKARQYLDWAIEENKAIEHDN